MACRRDSPKTLGLEFGDMNRPLNADLPTLAVDIAHAHESAQQAAARAIDHARRAGALLLQAKSLVEHGQWLPWLVANVTFSTRTAQLYMKLAGADPQRVAHLPVREAQKLLAEPRPASRPVGDPSDFDDDPATLPLIGQIMVAFMPDDEIAVVVPSLQHSGFFYTAALRFRPDLDFEKPWLSDGSKKPVHGTHVGAMLHVMGLAAGLTWEIGPCNAWTYNEFLYDSAEEARPEWLRRHLESNADNEVGSR